MKQKYWLMAYAASGVVSLGIFKPVDGDIQAVYFGGSMTQGDYVELMTFDAPKIIKRAAFICDYCDGVYADEPVTSCDCCGGPPKFIQGEITYEKGLKN